MLQNLAEGLNLKRIGPQLATLIAVLISSVVFGLAHASNASATALSAINTMTAALVLAGAYVLTGQLALPFWPARSMGLHCGRAESTAPLVGCLGRVL